VRRIAQPELKITLAGAQENQRVLRTGNGSGLGEVKIRVRPIRAKASAEKGGACELQGLLRTGRGCSMPDAG